MKLPTFTKHRTALVTCPFCGTLHDGATNIDSNAHAPKKGDVTLCFHCGEWAFFDDVPGGLRKPTDAEYDRIANNDNARVARKAWALAKMWRSE